MRSASGLSGGRGNAGRQQFQQGGGCSGQWVPGNVAQGNQGGAHGVMTGEGNQGGVGSVFTVLLYTKLLPKVDRPCFVLARQCRKKKTCAGGQAGVPNLAANGHNPSGCAARNLENDPLSRQMGVEHLMVVVTPVVNSQELIQCMDLEG